jgi:hypothetical protein
MLLRLFSARLKSCPDTKRIFETRSTAVFHKSQRYLHKIPQGSKPDVIAALFGTTEVVP